MAMDSITPDEKGLQHEKTCGRDNAGQRTGYLPSNFYGVCHMPGCDAEELPGKQHFCKVHERLDQLKPVLFGQSHRLPAERTPLTAVYLVGSRLAGAVKIGVADNVTDRIATLQTGAPFKIEIFGAIYTLRDHAFLIERACHEKLREFGFHLSGEWFDVEPEDAYRLIAKMADTQGLAWMAPGKYLDLLYNVSERFCDVLHRTTDVRLVSSAMLKTSILSA